MAVSMTIGAMLSSGFKSSIGQALKGVGDLDKGMSGLQNRLLDIGQAIGSLYGIRKLVSGSSDLSAQLKDAGITAEVTNERLGELRQTFRTLSGAGRTNQSAKDLLGVYRELVGAGLDDSLAGNEKLLESVGRTGTAADVNLKALARTTYTLVEMLGIKPEGLAAEYDRLAYLGGEGSFEMEDMAQHFAELAPQAKLLGMTGSEAIASMGAALQVAKDGASTPGEAANNMKNFMIKATSPETVKAFKEHGVSLMALLGKAAKEGKNPMEVLLEKTDAMLGADATKRKFRLGALFGDQQAQAFVISMLEGRKKYEKLKGEAMSGAAAGKVDKDYAWRMEEFAAKSTAFANALSNLGDSIGRSLLPPLGAVMTVATPVVSWLSGVSDTAPGTTLAITGLGATMMTLGPMLRLGSFALGLFGGANVAAAGGVSILSKALRINPIGLAVSAIALLAGVIYDNWKPITDWFGSVWEDVKPYWESFASFISDYVALVSTPIKMVMGAYQALGSLATGKGFDTSAMSKTWEDAGAAGGRLWDRVPKAAQRPDFGIIGQDAARSTPTAGAPGSGDGKVRVEVDFSNVPLGTSVSTDTVGSRFSDVNTGLQMAGP